MFKDLDRIGYHLITGMHEIYLLLRNSFSLVTSESERICYHHLVIN